MGDKPITCIFCGFTCLTQPTMNLHIPCSRSLSSINHPPHYTFSRIEVIDAIEAWNLDFRLANVIKYVARAGKKNRDTELEDLQKAAWYLQRRINELSPRSNPPQPSPMLEVPTNN